MIERIERCTVKLKRREVEFLGRFKSCMYVDMVSLHDTGMASSYIPVFSRDLSLPRPTLPVTVLCSLCCCFVVVRSIEHLFFVDRRYHCYLLWTFTSLVDQLQWYVRNKHSPLATRSEEFHRYGCESNKLRRHSVVKYVQCSATREENRQSMLRRGKVRPGT